MIRIQIYLTTQEQEQLCLLSKESGLHQSAIIREAIDQFIERKFTDKKKKQDSIKAAFGIWADREDLPDLRKMSWDRI